MGGILILTADQRRHILETGLGVRMGFNLPEAANQVVAVIITPAVMGMVIHAFHIAAGQVALAVQAIRRVLVWRDMACEGVPHLICRLCLGLTAYQRVARKRMDMLLKAAHRNTLQRVRAPLQGYHRQQQHKCRQQRNAPPDVAVPPPFPYKVFCLKIRLSLHGFNFLNHYFRVPSPRGAYSMTPKRFRGQILNTTRPTTCSCATQPTAVLRLSDDVAR